MCQYGVVLMDIVGVIVSENKTKSKSRQKESIFVSPLMGVSEGIVFILWQEAWVGGARQLRSDGAE